MKKWLGRVPQILQKFIALALNARWESVSQKGEFKVLEEGLCTHSAAEPNCALPGQVLRAYLASLTFDLQAFCIYVPGIYLLDRLPLVDVGLRGAASGRVLC